MISSNILVHDNFVSGNIIEESLMYIKYPLMNLNGILPMHDYSHPKCLKKRFVILHALFKLNQNFATLLDMDYFQIKGHS